MTWIRTAEINATGGAPPERCAMAKRRCAACVCLFVPRRNVPHQRYCAERTCQCTRRRRWQRHKLKADADYRANQAAAQRRWRERHPEYWRAYRQRVRS